MLNIFRRPTVSATLIAVAVMAGVNFFHKSDNPIIGAIIAGLIFFAIFSAFMAWVDRTGGK